MSAPRQSPSPHPESGSDFRTHGGNGHRGPSWPESIEDYLDSLHREIIQLWTALSVLAAATTVLGIVLIGQPT